MYYYYVKYNVYEEAKPPAEQERWLQFDEHNDESAVKKYLAALHNAGITIIRLTPVEQEQYLAKQKESY